MGPHELEPVAVLETVPEAPHATGRGTGAADVVHRDEAVRMRALHREVPTQGVEPALDPQAVQTMLESTSAHSAPPSRLPVLDLEQVQSIRGLGKPQLFERMCDMLYATSKDAFGRLDAAIADGNLEEVAAAAHALKSPVNNLGGRRLADLLERCEVAAREGADMAAVRRSAAGLKAHYAALVAALQGETRRSTGTG